MVHVHIDAKPMELTKAVMSRLFFVARNLAVEAFVRSLQDKAKAEGFDLEVKPSFDSRSSSFVLTHRYKTTRKLEDALYIWLDRDTIHPFNDIGSPCVFQLKSISATTYHDTVTPKKAQEMAAFLEREDIVDFIRKSIAGFNHPVTWPEYTSHICV